MRWGCWESMTRRLCDGYPHGVLTRWGTRTVSPVGVTPTGSPVGVTPTGCSRAYSHGVQAVVGLKGPALMAVLVLGTAVSVMWLHDLRVRTAIFRTVLQRVAWVGVAQRSVGSQCNMLHRLATRCTDQPARSHSRPSVGARSSVRACKGTLGTHVLWCPWRWMPSIRSRVLQRIDRCRARGRCCNTQRLGCAWLQHTMVSVVCRSRSCGCVATAPSASP